VIRDPQAIANPLISLRFRVQLRIIHIMGNREPCSCSTFKRPIGGASRVRGFGLSRAPLRPDTCRLTLCQRCDRSRGEKPFNINAVSLSVLSQRKWPIFYIYIPAEILGLILRISLFFSETRQTVRQPLFHKPRMVPRPVLRFTALRHNSTHITYSSLLFPNHTTHA
jgi:hypothetical protein